VSLTKREALPLAQRACAIAHGRGAGMSLLALWELVLDEGLPSRAEREQMLEERLGDTALSSSPEPLLDRRDAPDATA
jgi:hypothetical protein